MAEQGSSRLGKLGKAGLTIMIIGFAIAAGVLLLVSSMDSVVVIDWSQLDLPFDFDKSMLYFLAIPPAALGLLGMLLMFIGIGINRPAHEAYNEENYIVKAKNYRGLKIFLIIISILFMVGGLLAFLVMSVLTTGAETFDQIIPLLQWWNYIPLGFFVVGLPLLIIATRAIKVRSAPTEDDNEITKRHDGNRLYVHLKEIETKKVATFFQDIINDGFIEIEKISNNGQDIVFKTPFTVSQLEEQANLRQRLYAAPAKKRDYIRSLMPDYYADEPTIHADEVNTPDGEQFTEKVPHYRREKYISSYEVKYEVDQYGNKTAVGKKPVYDYKEVFDYWSMDTFQPTKITRTWKYNNDNSVVTAKNGTQFISYYHFSALVASKRI